MCSCAARFRWVNRTPRGSVVDPDVYCRYTRASAAAGKGRQSCAAATGPGAATRAHPSGSQRAAVSAPTWLATARRGAQSSAMPATRAAWRPPAGKAGTAMAPAVQAAEQEVHVGQSLSEHDEDALACASRRAGGLLRWPSPAGRGRCMSASWRFRPAVPRRSPRRPGAAVRGQRKRPRNGSSHRPPCIPPAID